LYKQYKDRVEFYLVYIREAHPTDGKQAPANRKEGILFAQPKSLAERVGIYTKMCDGLKLNLPALIDGLDDKVGKAYNAWPDRLYLIDQEGKIVYLSLPGPRNFKPEELGTAIEKLVKP
jgi:hypothetical protein